MSNMFKDIRASVAGWRRRRDAVAALSALNDHLLRDIGLNRSEIASVVSELDGQAQPTRVQALGAAVSANRNESAPAKATVEKEWLEAALGVPLACGTER